MTNKGSNDLNLLLKAKVVKIKAVLDLANSMPKIRQQVDEISALLENKPVKLKVKLHATIKDLNSQMKLIREKFNSGAIKPIKVNVELDIKGSATQIKNQLKEVNETVEEFSKKYGQQVKKVQDMTNKAQSTSLDSNGISKQNNHAKQYINNLKEAEKLLIAQHGKGLFSSTELKDAEGNLTGFTASLEKANGVVQQIKYEWDKDKDGFFPINQKTATNSQKATKEALKNLRELDREILKLGKDGEKFAKEAMQLEKRASHNTLTQDAVNLFKTRINDEKALLGIQKKENDALREQKRLLADVNRAIKKTKGDSQEKLRNIQPVLDLNNPLSSEDLSNIKQVINEIKKGYTDQIASEKKLATVAKNRKDILHEIKTLERTTTRSGAGANSAKYVAETKLLAKSIDSMEEYIVVKKRMDSINQQQGHEVITQKTVTQLEKLKKAMINYSVATGRSLHAIEARYDQVAHNVKNNLEMATNETKRYMRLLDEFNLKQKIDQKRNSVVQNADHRKVADLIEQNDIDGIKNYIGHLNKAKVATLKLVTDSKGISKITATMEGAGKTTKQFSYEIDNVNRKLRNMGQADVFNRNANLGVFEQLRIAMARVPVWMTAMTAFYGTIRSVQMMTGEILKVDSALTELKRVADSHINIDVMFKGAIEMSGRLGNNIHDVMQSVNDLARTYGHFNERQLLAIANTATLMSNVSDLNAQEATESLVGTMNAFNKSAEESIQIVDSLNEVDNNFAISTKQLATGLKKSASTARTFGVTMEETVGHITAIGAVTMESGNIIGKGKIAV